MLYGRLTEQIIGCAFEVMKELGPGFLESVYEKAMLFELQQKGLKVANQQSIKVYYKSQNVGLFFADLFVENTVIVELKSVEALVKEHQAQTINYLKATAVKIALPLNFGKSTLQYKRLYIPKKSYSC